MKTLLFLAAFLLAAAVSLAEPQPGSIFRDFTFAGRRFSELDPNCKRDFSKTPGFINKPHMVVKPLELDLDRATSAEMCVEYWGGHIGTSEQKFRVNGNDWIYIPQPKTTPTRPEHFHRTLLGNETVPVPLAHLKNGRNEVQFTAGPQVKYSFNWGFYWIYSFTIRVYYEPSKAHPTGRIVSPAAGATVADSQQIEIVAKPASAPIRQVDVIGCYEDFNWEGDGIFTQWHYITEHGKIAKHIGTATKSPYRVTWNTQWVPDQPQPVKLMARITDETSMSVMTPSVDGLTLRRDRSVKTYQPHDVPERFAVRTKKTMSCNIAVPADSAKAKAARLVLSTWSGATDTGVVHKIMFNGKDIGNNFGRFHDYSFNMLDAPLNLIRKGDNTVAIYSEFDGHALEINWPGPCLLVEFAK